MRALAAVALVAWTVMASPSAGSPQAAPADATDQPRKLAEYGDWRALAIGSGDSRACYVAPGTVPPPPEGRARDRPLLYVTYRPPRNALNVVAYFAGYRFRPDSEVELDFGFAKFRLFTNQETGGAWSGSADMDGRIVEAMKAGSSVTARGIDEAGNEVSDTFSLMGFTLALWRAANECRVP
jgi:hypothetical protein